MSLYKETEANFPRLNTDKLFVDYSNNYSYNGFVDKSIRFIENFQLLSPEHWARFVRQFREMPDSDNAAWRGEFWGKMMRGACFTYSYTKNADLYDILAATVKDMINTADENGRISTYVAEKEFDGWDVWSRKYVLLGMQYFMEICDDENLKAEIVASMKAQVDYIASKIGPKEEGKKPITLATRHWRGLNSSSLLEPIVRLYTITKEQKYFDFATYIVNEGGTDIVNIFDLAYQDKLMPYQYPVTKAYEMTSCFEGLLEYYRLTGIEKYKTSIINFANRVLETDFTIIGCCGCTHELFDHSTVRQANTTNEIIAQETCVTVTLMKFFYQLNLLTGDSKYADAVETSLYNAYLGAINTEKILDKPTHELYDHLNPESFNEFEYEPLPFDSYSPLTAGKRGEKIGGFQIMSDNHYYGCCACIGAVGTGLFARMALLTSRDGFALNLFIDGRIESKTYGGTPVTFITETEYPKRGNVRVTVNIEKEEAFELLLRNPYWSKTTAVSVNGEKAAVNDGYIAISRTWKNGDTVEIELDMRTEVIYPIPYGNQILMNEVIWGHNYMISTYDEEDPIAKKHIALRRGPIVLAQENRLGYSVDTPITVKVNNDGYVDVKFPEKDIAPYEHILEVQVPLANGSMMTVTDYASAGKLWNEESKMAAWMLTE